MTQHRYPCTATAPAEDGHEHQCMHNDAVSRYPVQHACRCGHSWTVTSPPPIDTSWLSQLFPPPEPGWIARHPAIFSVGIIAVVVVLLGLTFAGVKI